MKIHIHRASEFYLTKKTMNTLQNQTQVQKPSTRNLRVERFLYDNEIVRNFAFATTFWAVGGMIFGLLAALQLTHHMFNFEVAEITFGRIRPIHTNAIIFAFVGNGFFAGCYYSMPRLLKTPMYSRFLGKFHFWGWQAIIVGAAITLMLGFNTTKEYAELEWPLDIAIAVVWVAFGINMLMTTLKRREKHLYVAIWFYIASFVTVALLHIFNSLALPVSWFKSYSIYAGVQDALVQWWYGHNAVAFFLTTPYLGLMYYFVPKAANRPVYSYRLSIIHYWALIFIYIWAGPHHLLYTALPDWAQALGTVFSLMLIAPSWGGMLNGLLTLRGAWDRVRQDPVLKFFVVAVTAYGMSTFEGPMLSFKTFNAMSHYTDWTIAHVHVGGLGWNGFLTFGMLYWMLPRLYGTRLFSRKLAEAHFWIGTLGIIFYVVPLYVAGWTQSSMWKEFTAEGFLKYPNFLETVVQILPMYMMRAIGGTLYLAGALLMVYNLIRTVQQGKLVKFEEASAPSLKEQKKVQKAHAKPGHWHGWIERRPVQMFFWTFVAVAIGGFVEYVPTAIIKSNVPTISAVQPYTPLELTGRDLYMRENCNVCHSQMIRPFRSETERYGEYSKAGEFVYDHPFLWGSKRTGPDLHRIGGEYPDSWHYTHMLDPRAVSSGSIMPAYPWMIEDAMDVSTLENKINALRTLGVPYPKGYEKEALGDLIEQAESIQANLAKEGIKVERDREIIAMIAYLQRLGTDIKGIPKEDLPRK